MSSFELPEASPRVHGLVAQLLSVRRGPRPITLGFGTQVYGRFSLGDRRSALMSNNWVAGLNPTAAVGAWTVTGEIYHESGHLGDEHRDGSARPGSTGVARWPRPGSRTGSARCG